MPCQNQELHVRADEKPFVSVVMEVCFTIPSALCYTPGASFGKELVRALAERARQIGTEARSTDMEIWKAISK